MKEEEYFVRVPISLLRDNTLSRSALIVYAILLDKAKDFGSFGGCELTIGEIAKWSGLSEHTVRRSERQLVDAGYLEIERTGRASVLVIKKYGIHIQSYSAINAYRKVKEG